VVLCFYLECGFKYPAQAQFSENLIKIHCPTNKTTTNLGEFDSVFTGIFLPRGALVLKERVNWIKLMSG
jgi:hypothetical protein